MLYGANLCRTVRVSCVIFSFLQSSTCAVIDWSITLSSTLTWIGVSRSHFLHVVEALPCPAVLCLAVLCEPELC